MGMKQYNRRECVTCNAYFEVVVIADNGVKSFSDYNISSMRTSAKFENTYFDSRQQLKGFEDLYAIACPQCCIKYPSKHDLITHCRKDHNLHFCKVCLSRRKGVVVRQQRLYTHAELRAHLKYGDAARGSEGPIPVHPTCNLCNEKYIYDADDRAFHMIEKHVCCQLCRRKNIEEWLTNDERLVEHYQAAHLTCDDPMCCAAPMENVYDNEISFQAHMLKVHGDKIKSKELLKKTQRVNISFERRPGSNTTMLTAQTYVAGYQDINFDDDPREQNRVLMNEIRKLKGDDGFVTFRDISGDFFRGGISTDAYYERFCEMFRGCSTTASIWMLLVSSLPNADLRNDLYRVHYESVRDGGGFNVGRSSSTNDASKSKKEDENKKKDRDKIFEPTSCDESSELNVDGLNVSIVDKLPSPSNNKGPIHLQLDGSAAVNANAATPAKAITCREGGNLTKTGKKGRFKKKEVLYRL